MPTGADTPCYLPPERKTDNRADLAVKVKTATLAKEWAQDLGGDVGAVKTIGCSQVLEKLFFIFYIL
jgi:hypothetical protein